jgi:hypothetical protein
MDDLMLETLVVRAAAAQTYPPTPAMRARVVAKISRQPDTQPRSPQFSLAMALGGAVVVAVAVVLAVPGSRSAVADFFGIEGSRVGRLPTAAPGTTATPFPAVSELPPNAVVVSLDEAEEILGFVPGLPDGYGEPEEIFVADYGDQSAAILRYDGFDLWQTAPRGEIIFGKGLPEGVDLTELTVDGRPAYWVEGGEHVVSVFDEDDRLLPGSERTVARNTLILNTGHALYRIETDATLDEAVAIAEALP